MQYILTEEEYQSLKTIQKEKTLQNRTHLQRLCTDICNRMPVYWGWGEPEDPKPWGCMLTAQDSKEPYEWYCDSCPVQSICPADKGYSK